MLVACVQDVQRSVTCRMDLGYEKAHTQCGAWTFVRLLGVDDEQVSSLACVFATVLINVPCSYVSHCVLVYD